jgi:hypothetical protein
MPISPVGNTNLAAIGVPNVIIQIVPPNPLLNGVPTNIIGVVGTASWGPVNSQVVVGSLAQQIANFGQPANANYDMGTQVYTSYLQGANNFVCVRVTDGTDVPAWASLNDSVAVSALVLNALYTGVVGNTLNAAFSLGSKYTSGVPVYKLTVWLSGGVPEVYDNIGGSGTAFWTNVVNAVNLGQGNQRPPSQIVQAGIPGVIASVTVVNAGSYVTLPTASATIGSSATFTLHSLAVSGAIAAGGSGYAVSDTVTLTGGTFATATTVTVTAVNGSGAITAFNITTPGNYSVLPSNPVSQGSTSGSGSSATFTMAWGLLSVVVGGSGGSGYTSNSKFVLSPNNTGTVGALVITPSPSSNSPSLAAYTFANGTNGNGSVTDSTLIGSDVLNPRTGMYALRNSNASIGLLADQTNSAYWSAQATFGSQEGIYMIIPMANGYQNNISGAISIKQAAGLFSFDAKLMLGDWCQILDPFNNVNRFVNPCGFVAGILATQLPDNSSLNKILNGVVVTAKTQQQLIYSNADLSQLQTGGIDVITSPIPASASQYGVRLGINTSGNVATIGDNYTRMVNFLAETFNQGLGGFIGLPQTTDVQNQARATLQGFLANIQQLGLIGTLNGNPAYQVILDSTNNPPQQVALGYMVANIQVTLWSIIFQFVVNLQAGQSVQIQTLPPQLI